MSTIKDLPEHAGLREKLRERGPAALTDEKLVAAILGMGTAGVDGRTMAKQVAALIREHREALALKHLLSLKNDRWGIFVSHCGDLRIPPDRHGSMQY